MTNNLEKIIKLYHEYHCNKKYVYWIVQDNLTTKCENDKKWLIVMEKLRDTKTNEDRKDVKNSDFALFRASKLKVIRFINIDDPDFKDKVVIDTNIRRYVINRVITHSEYDPIIDNIESGGLYYYNTIEAAYYARNRPDNYTGKWVKFYRNGNKQAETEFLNGVYTGHWIIYFETGIKQLEGDYVDGVESGIWTEFWENGKKRVRGKKLNDEESGYWYRWSETGKKLGKVKYVNGEIKGRCILWNTDGSIKINGVYKLDKKTNELFKLQINENKKTWIKLSNKFPL